MKKQAPKNLSREDAAVVEQQAASGLRLFYDRAIHEPLPDRMNELLERLKALEAAGFGPKSRRGL